MISRRARLHCLLVSAGECTKHFLYCNIITLDVIKKIINNFSYLVQCFVCMIYSLYYFKVMLTLYKT